MGLYSEYVFPRLMDWSLKGEEFQRIRKDVLADVRGNVFEIGFGTGLNLPHYPASIKRIETADPNAGARKLAEDRIRRSQIEVVYHGLGGEKLLVESNSFSTVVCTFTLCSIPDVNKAIREMWRILKPEGRFHFVEHGLSDNPPTQWWQHKLTPIQKIIGDGCHLDRDPASLLRNNGFQIERLDNFYLSKAPRFAGYIYRGVAVKM